MLPLFSKPRSERCFGIRSLEFGRFVQKMIRTHATSFLAKIGS